MPAGKDEDLADLIRSQIKIEWDEIKPIIPEMSTEELVDLMVELKLYVNKTLALEIAKKGGFGLLPQETFTEWATLAQQHLVASPCNPHTCPCKK